MKNYWLKTNIARVINSSRRPFGLFLTFSFSSAPIDSGMDSDQCRDQVLYQDNILDFFHLQSTSLETHNDDIYFKNPFGFQDNFWCSRRGQLASDNTIAMLSVLILIEKYLRLLRYLHLNIFPADHLKVSKLILILSKTWIFLGAIDT